MYRILVTISVAMAMGVVGSAMAQQPEAPKVDSWSNSKTENQKTVFQVKPGEKITFSIKAQNAEKYQWLVNEEIQEAAGGNSFTWTVPNSKGMWKILVKTTNEARQQWIKERAALWNKWMEGKEKEKFIRDMVSHHLYPMRARKEWVFSTFLTKVNPGESIQKAVNSLPPEGGIVQLAPGVHHIRETIVISRSNVVIQGTHSSEIRSHDTDKDIFVIPHKSPSPKEPWKTRPMLRNFLFKGFKVTSTYKYPPRGKCLVNAWNVQNITVEDILDKSYLAVIVGVNATGSGSSALSKDIFVNNNTSYYSTIAFCYSENIYVTDNTLIESHYGGPHGINANRNNKYIFITGNRVRHAGRNSALIMYSSRYWFVRDNIFKNAQIGIYVSNCPRHSVVSNNIITGSGDAGIYFRPQTLQADNTFVNNRIYNCRGHGIFAGEHSGVYKVGDAKIMNNTIYNCRGDGVHATTKWMNLTLENNIIANSGGYGINRGAGGITMSHNDLWDNKKGNYKGVSTGTGDISVAPLFASPANGEFHLKSKTGRWGPKAKRWVKDAVHSPCIDAGDPKADFSEEPAPNGGRVNMGA